MVSKHSVDAISVWFDGPTYTLKNTDAKLYEKSRHWKLKIPADEFAASDLPDQSLTDWCIAVTPTGQDTIHGEISHYTKANYRIFKWPRDNPTRLYP